MAVRPAKTQISLGIRCPHEEILGPQLPIEHTAKTLGAHSFCWFCHVAAQLLFSVDGIGRIWNLIISVPYHWTFKLMDRKQNMEVPSLSVKIGSYSNGLLTVLVDEFLKN